MFCPADERTEVERARQVIPNAVAGDGFSPYRKLALFVENTDVRSLDSVRQIKASACQPFVQKPDTAGVLTGRFETSPIPR